MEICDTRQYFSPMPTPAEISEWDKASFALGVPDVVLMENAARAAADVLAQEFGDVRDLHVLVFMGAGNNGGDAVCLARHLLDVGARVLVVHTRPLGHYVGMTGRFVRLARRCGVNWIPARAWLRHGSGSGFPAVPDVIVDGLLGTGFSSLLRELEAGLVAAINRLSRDCFVLALDIPSGLDGLHGVPRPDAVRANVTVTFAAAKPGLMFPEAAPYTGRVVVRDIGIPLAVQQAFIPSFVLMEPDLLRLIPRAGASWHKGKAGHVVILGGSDGLCGAPHLAAMAALRTGAGLVTVAAPLPLLDRIRSDTPDIMTCSVGSAWGAQAGAQLRSLLARADALVCGPGLGRTPEVGMALESVLALPDRPSAVVDADALFALAGQPQLRGLLRPEDILTPHPGEAARFLGAEAGYVQRDRVAALQRLVDVAPSVWILKGAGTLVQRQGGVIRLCRLAVPTLAVGGSGDVLAGIIGALQAVGMDAELAACAGVYLHARAGQLLATDFPYRGNTASEIAEVLPHVPRS